MYTNIRQVVRLLMYGEKSQIPLWPSQFPNNANQEIISVRRLVKQTNQLKTLVKKEN